MQVQHDLNVFFPLNRASDFIFTQVITFDNSDSMRYDDDFFNCEATGCELGPASDAGQELRQLEGACLAVMRRKAKGKAVERFSGAEVEKARTSMQR